MESKIAVAIGNNPLELLGLMTAIAKTTSSGSGGDYAQGILEIDGEQYQVQAQLVKVESDRKTYLVQLSDGLSSEPHGILVATWIGGQSSQHKTGKG